jgi:tRNA A-37 threonylcarbamoyl transferase component Bud32
MTSNGYRYPRGYGLNCNSEYVQIQRHFCRVVARVVIYSSSKLWYYRMWKLARNSVQHGFPRNFVAMLGIGSFSAAAAIASDSNDDHESAMLTRLRRIVPSTLHSEVLCEPMAVRLKGSSLKRHQTIQKMEKTATSKSLHELYKVDWKNTLGKGNFGSVHTAIDLRTGETVAVKKISRKLTDNATFQREMDALLHIRQSGGHPNICGLRENFDDGNYFYLVIDYVCGGEMFDHLCLEGAYSEADAARLIRETASAFAYLHGINIVHGDVKPENLMLSTKHASDAVIKVVDFGCAQVTHGDELAQSLNSETFACNAGVARTPAYCPPEVLEAMLAKDGGRIEPSFDMWVCEASLRSLAVAHILSLF